MKAFKILRSGSLCRTVKCPGEWGLLQKKILHRMSSNYYEESQEGVLDEERS